MYSVNKLFGIVLKNGQKLYSNVSRVACLPVTAPGQLLAAPMQADQHSCLFARGGTGKAREAGGRCSLGGLSKERGEGSGLSMSQYIELSCILRRVLDNFVKIRP